MSLRFTSIRRPRWPQAWLAVMLATWLALALGAGSASAQSIIDKLVSPGPLSNDHARFDSSCSSCHVSFNKSAQSGKCLDCHKDVAADVTTKRGFHGRSPTVSGVECKTCHTEHVGRGAKLVQLDRQKFNHGLTDFPLTGKHAPLDCAQCHAAGTKFAKAPSDCASCHRNSDPHKGKLGDACASCHTATAWKAVTYDHSKTAFPLAGAHARTECSSCHINQTWKGTQTACSACHAKDDAHRGKLGTDCASCHNVEAWKVNGFDHARTGFRLVGAHARTDCAGCHKGGVRTRLPTECNACHAGDDKHKGANGVDCAACHTSVRWADVTFNHTATRFPLKGRHALTACATCHTRPIGSWKPPTDCIGCHRADDKHKGLLGADCQNCHVETAWAKIRFDHGKDARFALNGKHASADCATCHVQPVKTKAPPTSCIGCHRKDDPHKGQLGDGCASCHGEADWKKQVRFDHGLSNFPLLGKHARVACKDCHASPAYLDAKTDCASCHARQDPHAGRYGKDCAQCHNPADWKRWSFDHDRQTRYALTGKHRGVDCASCHRTPAKLSDRCVSCHSVDDKHRGSFGATCERCHTTEAFWAVDVRRGN